MNYTVKWGYNENKGEKVGKPVQMLTLQYKSFLEFMNDDLIHNLC